MLNVIALIGRITFDPEVKQVSNGTTVANLRIAVDRDYSGSEGKAPTDFIDVTAWRKTAEFIQRNCFKGQLVAVTGRLESREWTDGNGSKRTGISVNALSVYPMQWKSRDAEGTQSVGMENTGFVPDNDPYNEDSLPF